MIGIQNPWAYTGSQIPETGLGFSLKTHLDPRKRFKRHLKFAKKSLDPRTHLKFAKRSLDPRTHLKFAKRSLDPAGLVFKRGQRRKGKDFKSRMLARIAKRRGVMAGSTPATVTMAVQSPEATVALGDLGIKFPKIPRKWRKRIAIAAAVGAAAYFGGAPLVAKFGAKAMAKKGGMMVGKAALKKGGKKLSKKAKKKLKKQLAGAAKTVVQAQLLPSSPDSVTAQAGAYGVPTGGSPGAEYTALPSGYDEETGEVTTGISSRAGIGGVSPVILLAGLALGAFALLGPKWRR